MLREFFDDIHAENIRDTPFERPKIPKRNIFFNFLASHIPSV